MVNCSKLFVLAILSQIVVQVAFGSYGVVLKQFAQGANVNPLIFSLLRDMCATPVLLLCGIIFESKQNDVQPSERNDNDTEDTELDDMGNTTHTTETVEEAQQSPKCSINLKLPNRNEFLLFALLGITGMFGNQLLYIQGVYFSNPAIASMFQPLVAIFSAIFATVTCTDKPSASKVYSFIRWVGVILAVGGSMVTVIEPILGDNSDRETSTLFLGNICFIGNTICMATYVVLQKRLIFYEKKLDNSEEEQEEIPQLNFFDHWCSVAEDNRIVGIYYSWSKYPITATAWTYLFGAIFMGIASIYYVVEDTSVFTSIDSQIIIPLLYSVFISSSLCYGLITFGNKHLPSTIVTAFWPLQIGVALTLSFLIFGTEMTYLQWLGCAFILLGLAGVTISNN